MNHPQLLHLHNMSSPQTAKGWTLANLQGSVKGPPTRLSSPMRHPFRCAAHVARRSSVAQHCSRQVLQPRARSGPKGLAFLNRGARLDGLPWEAVAAGNKTRIATTPSIAGFRQPNLQRQPRAIALLHQTSTILSSSSSPSPSSSFSTSSILRISLLLCSSSPSSISCTRGPFSSSTSSSSMRT